ncbi:MAG: endonuclease III [Anaerovoracaceae bacterium]|jgi:endonuclease-3
MAKLKKAQIAEIIEKMGQMYPEAECALVHENPFQLLVAVVLSAQTTDKSVNKVSPILFDRYPDAAALASARLEDLEEILKPIGMYRTKARNIIALSKMLQDKHDGQVPGDFQQLTELPGVGRKTANVVLAVGFGEPRIAVDTHVFRLANRIGLTAEKNVLNTELALMEVIPKERWIMMHHALIWHGRRVCSARNPKCDQCGIYGLCRRNGLGEKA